MEKKAKEALGVTFNGNVTFQGPMFDIHDNLHVHIHNQMKAPSEDWGNYEFVDLRFFDAEKLGTTEKQNQFRNCIQKILPKMDVDSGRDWIIVYIAYHFSINKMLRKKSYSDFFADIEGLFPDVLKKINKDASGDKRYKSYTESLASECDKWFIDQDCLPPVNEWRSKNYNYAVDKDRRDRIQSLTTDLYQGILPMMK